MQLPGGSRQSRLIMKTTDEIFNWLTRNSSYYVNRKSNEDIEKLIAESKQDDGITLHVAVNYVPAFHAKLEDFVAFIGEPYSFKKHLLPLIDAGLIACSGYSRDGFYSTTSYKRAFDGVWGLVKFFETGESFVQWWLGGDPNEVE